MATEDRFSNCKHIQVVRGLPFPFAPWRSNEAREQALDYKPRDGDLIIAGYLKTGTTWVAYIVMQVLTRGEGWLGLWDTMSRTLESTGSTKIESLTDRWYKTHMPCGWMQRNENAKLIYVYRHPEDTLVSYFHFYHEIYPDMPLELDQFYRLFVDGLLAFGKYFDHVLSFYERRDDPNVLLVSYEKLHEDRRREVLRIAEFMGEEYRADLVGRRELLDEVVDRTSFGYMKANVDGRPSETFVTHGIKSINYFRKGTVGSGKIELSEDQRRGLKNAAEALKTTSIYEEWYGGEKKK